VIEKRTFFFAIPVLYWPCNPDHRLRSRSRSRSSSSSGKPTSSVASSPVLLLLTRSDHSVHFFAPPSHDVLIERWNSDVYFGPRLELACFHEEELELVSYK
jgi:hypothetical protein